MKRKKSPKSETCRPIRRIAARSGRVPIDGLRSRWPIRFAGPSQLATRADRTSPRPKSGCWPKDLLHLGYPTPSRKLPRSFRHQRRTARASGRLCRDDHHGFKNGAGEVGCQLAPLHHADDVFFSLSCNGAELPTTTTYCVPIRLERGITWSRGIWPSNPSRLIVRHSQKPRAEHIPWPTFSAPEHSSSW